MFTFEFNKRPTAIGAAALALSLPANALAQSDGAADDGAVLADAPGAAPVLGALGLLGVILLVMAISDGDEEGVPASP